MAHRAIHTQKAPAPVGPYNQAVEAGDMLFISGQIALIPETGTLQQQDLEQETRQVMDNLLAVLESAGYRLDEVVKCSIFILDMAVFGTVNKVYATYFDDKTAPARETVAVRHLPKGARVEISAIAVRKEAR